MRAINKREVLVSGIGLVIARAVMFQMNPMAIGFFSAFYREKSSRLLMTICTIIGMATVMTPIETAKYSLILVVIGIVTHLSEKKDKKLSIYIMALIGGIVTSAMTLAEGVLQINFQYYLLNAALEGVIAFAFTIIFHKGILYFLHGKRGQVLNNEQIISIIAMAAVFVYAIPKFPQIEISVVEACAYFIILLFGYKYGSGAGAITGAACGAVLNFQERMQGFAIDETININVIGIMCILGILAGMVREVGRIATAVVFLIGTVSLGYLYEPYLISVEQIRALASGLVVFILLPKSLIYRIDIGKEEVKEDILGKQGLQDIAKVKLKEFSESFQKLSSTFHNISDTKSGLTRQDFNHIFDDLSERICKNCDSCEECWKENFYDTYKSAFNLLNSADRNGTIQEKDVPVAFAERCIRLDDFIEETNRGLELAKINLSWQNRMAESREAIAGQLCEVANIITDFSMDLYGTVEVEDTKETLIISKLAVLSLEVKRISILEKRNKKQEIYVIAKTKKGRCMTTREAAAAISDTFGKRMRPADGTKNIISREYETYVFVEDVNFKTLTGMARTTKTNEKVSGDNFSFIQLESGEMIMTLSDGMGTGVKACEESESVIELLEQFMEAGFKEESAIKLINSILVLKSEQQSFSTIDMSVINLFTGTCEFIKIGASTTFIKRDNWVETISSTTLPVGVFNQVDFDGITKKLYDGDYVIMVTDGVLDCINQDDKEKYIEDLIMDIESSNPQDIANYILDKAMEQNNYTAVDDMTVLVAGVWKK